MVTVTLPKWLSRAENLPLILEGEIEAETARGVLFTGCALVRPSVTCLRCGRELTNPVSRTVGVGPECCVHWGISRPDYESSVALDALIREKTKLTRWLPKSQVTIVGERTPRAADNGGPLQLTLEPDRIRLKCNYADKDKAKSVPGYAWDSETKTWTYPSVRGTIESLRTTFGDRLEIPDEVEELFRPKQLKGHDYLYEFQREGTEFLLREDRALLADDMGLGKTVMTIAAVDSTIECGRTLCIVPNAHTKGWRTEFGKFAPELDVRIVKGTHEQREAILRGPGDVLIIHWEGARILHEVIGEIKWDLIVCDEAHKLKNRKTQTVRNLRSRLKAVPRVYMLTGTPVLNRPDELWSLLNILQPQLYRSYWRWVREYCELIVSPYGTKVGRVLPHKRDELKATLNQILLRRTKGETLKGMPPKTVQQVYVDLSLEQVDQYDEMADQMRTRLESGEEISATVIIAQLMRLRQICIDPNIMVEHNVEPLRGPKADAVLEILDGAGDQKVVVFSQFTRAIDALVRRLDTTEHRGRYETYTGRMTVKQREDAVERFQEDPDCRVILVSTTAGGQAITLTAGSIAVFIDKLWTPAMQVQAQDRLHRIGQTKPVTIIEVLTENTAEDRVEALLAYKQQVFGDMFSLDAENVSTSRGMTRTDWLTIFARRSVDNG